VAPTGPTTGDIVWKWDVWDHLIQDFDASKNNYGTVGDHPELVDINFVDPASPGGRDWLHGNAIEYNSDLDQIMTSLRNVSELWVIDHSTSTAEAASHSGGNSGAGGDLLYRWGNPQSYRAGTAADRQSFYQHNTHWIPAGLPGAGNILFFNNGPRPGGTYSTITEITPPVDGTGHYALTPGQAYEPAAPTWTYTAPNPADFFSMFISSAQRLPNGNTFIGSGVSGVFFEVTSDGTTVWKYISPVVATGPVVQGQTVPVFRNAAFRATRYPPDYAGLAGEDLTPGDPLETDTDGDSLSDLAESGYYGTDQLLADTDGDGCGDGREVGSDQMLGGQRDPLNPWDYFNPSQDGKNLVDDVLDVVHQFFEDDDDGNPGLPPYIAGYNPDTDRTLLGPNAWNLGPPNGQQRVDDILSMVQQFHQDCS